jgi:hypothetical protein
MPYFLPEGFGAGDPNKHVKGHSQNRIFGDCLPAAALFSGLMDMIVFAPG